MKKILTIVSLPVFVAILGFSNASWAVNRPNTPECADVNGRFDVNACLIQYIEPLKVETEQMWSRLLKLQGKSAEENPWTFRVDSSACDPDSQSYDKMFCLLQTPGKLAVEKYRIREEVRKLEIEQKIKRQRTKLALARITINKLMQENEKLAKKLTEAEKRNEEPLKQITVLSNKLAESNKFAEDQKKRADSFKTMSVALLLLLGIMAIVFIVHLAQYQYRKGLATDGGNGGGKNRPKTKG